MTVEEAVEDIVIRGVSELRKNAFGDDIEDAKSLPWTREQAWILMKQLSKQAEVRLTIDHHYSQSLLMLMPLVVDILSRSPHGLSLQGGRNTIATHGTC